MEIERLLRCASSSTVVYIEEVERLNHSILHHLEITLLYPLDWIAFGVRHDDIHDHAPDIYFKLGCWRFCGRCICSYGGFWRHRLRTLPCEGSRQRDSAKRKQNGSTVSGHCSSPVHIRITVHRPPLFVATFRASSSLVFCHQRLWSGGAGLRASRRGCCVCRGRRSGSRMR